MQIVKDYERIKFPLKAVKVFVGGEAWVKEAIGETKA
jgi:hypothetical protein